MEIKFTLDDDLILVHTMGRITEGPRESGAEPISAMLGPSVYSRKVLLDLSRTDFISSSGLGWLITCHKRFREAGGTFVIHSIVPIVEQMIGLMRLNRVLSIAPDLAAAKQQVEAPA